MFTKGLCQKNFLVNLKSEMKAGDLAVIRTTESSPGDDTKVKLRSCTFPKSAWNRRSREVYFDFLGNIAHCSEAIVREDLRRIFTIESTKIR